jgi:alcohol dehydrogenase
MTMMRVARVVAPGSPLEITELPVPEPGPGEARVRVEACGICHSDAAALFGGIPGLRYPLVPGHEIAGRVDALGAGVVGWQAGQRVGVGWFGGACGHCRSCRAQDPVNCENLRIPGITQDGGYAEYVVVHASALAVVPDDLPAVEAAPLLCAGVTTFNALRRSAALPGDLVAVLGVGGLGHLGIQYAAKLGFRTVAIARGADKEKLARELGADLYIDSQQQDPAEALSALGGAAAVLATAANSEAMSATVGGLAPRGQLLVVGVAPEPIHVSPAQLIMGSRSVVGHASGVALDSEQTLSFSVHTGVRPMIETAPLSDAAAAVQRMLSGQARFRMVLTLDG